jgi:hypothetical protein
VGAWIKGARQQSFTSYLGQTEQGEVLLTANESCGFVAIRTAAELLGHPEIYSEAMYEAFVRASVDHSTDTAEGLTPSALGAFVVSYGWQALPLTRRSLTRICTTQGHLPACRCYIST